MDIRNTFRPPALRRVDTLVVVGREPRRLMEQFSRAVGVQIPPADTSDLPRGEALLWSLMDHQVIRLTVEPSRSEQHRHRRKYAEGRLENERQFRFRGPGNKMDLPVQNLNMFVQIAEGIDSETWQFHLKQGDYSKWFRQVLKDLDLPSEIETIEHDSQVSEAESRQKIKEAILQKYTAPT